MLTLVSARQGGSPGVLLSVGFSSVSGLGRNWQCGLTGRPARRGQSLGSHLSSLCGFLRELSTKSNAEEEGEVVAEVRGQSSRGDRMTRAEPKTAHTLVERAVLRAAQPSRGAR